jgi:alpha-L-rhamnosidase
MKKIGFLSPLLYACMIATAQVQVSNLKVENLSNPLGIDLQQPHLSWQLTSDQRNVMQSAYEVRVSDYPDFKGTAVWSSGKVNSDQSVHVPYAGNQLQSGKKYYWEVRVWANGGNASNWSQPAYWQMSLLQPTNWQAQWIEPGYAEDSIMRPSPLLRKEFATNKKVQSATAFITSHGLYEGYINGKRIGDYCLTPGWTSYNKHLQYQTYDVTNLLNQGNNAIGVMLGSGWYRGYLAWGDQHNIYGKKLGLLLQLNIKYTDGTTATIISDGSWKSLTGAIRYSEIYNGETCDARDDKTGWTTPQYDDANWSSVTSHDYPKDILVANYNEPITMHETFKPVKFITTPKGEHVIDFGQNLVGFVQIKVSGKAGDSIILHHAEVLDKQGNFYTDNLRAAKQQDIYVLSGKGEEEFHPHFTFQGFRYIKIDGAINNLKPENFTAVAMYSNMQPTGTFTTSNPLINQLQHNIQWGQRGNFLDVPTDCPQRDERLGWTGDAQVFSRTATFNFNVDNFFNKWLIDVADDQLANGSVPHVIPNVLGEGSSGSTGWADVSTIIPWNLYLAYGDTMVLRQQYESMKKWVNYMQSKSTNDLWNTGFHFGDWLFYRPEDDNDGRSAITDKYLIAQCFYAHSTQLLINAAKVLGKQDDVNKYTDLLHNIKDAFVKEYMTPNGRLISSSQTAYVLALNFDMLPENLRAQAADRLVANVKDYGNHLTTGFLGTPYLCHVLTRFGHSDVAYNLLLQDTYPSWLYPVKMGATTIWERWDGQKPDSTFQTPGMNSFNHYSYGAIGDWMYRAMAGIDTYDDAPGYKHIRIMPHIGGNFSYVNADYKTNYGTLSSNWKVDSSNLQLDVEIPCNTTATIYIPAASADVVKEGNNQLSKVTGIKVSGKENEYVVVEVGSGKYYFTAP